MTENGATYLGIDVGTGSARAGLFTADGELLAAGAAALNTNRQEPDFVEQSSRQIWQACCEAVRTALSAGNVNPSSVKGIGFDATCSLVVLDRENNPLTVSRSGSDDWNVVVWMDHRAISQAQRVNETKDPLLARTGGKISPEMQLPKLLWLKEEMPHSWANAGSFFDLPDWLVHRATGENSRSLCSAVCKWTYCGEAGTTGEGWNAEFLKSVGLGDLVSKHFEKIGRRFLSPGEIGGRLTPDAATELGLPSGIPVAAGAIDAYAGAIGTLGIGIESSSTFTDRLALVGGTSTCHIAASEEALFIPGVWGPYSGALLPGLWANEGGQSVSGALIDHVLRGDVAWRDLEVEATERKCSVFDILNQRLDVMAEGKGTVAELSRDLHVQPDFHGNRSPIADSDRRGAIVGLSLNSGLDQLALVYLATVQALAYGTRHILDAFAEKGVRFKTIVMSGGLARNALYRQQHADATNCVVLTADHNEAVLLGSAIMGFVASGDAVDFPSAMAQMGGCFTRVQPRVADHSFHDRKYRVFRQMHHDFETYRNLMND